MEILSVCTLGFYGLGVSDARGKGAMHLLLHRVCGNKPGFVVPLSNGFLPYSAAFAPSANSLIASSVGDKGGVLVKCAQLDRNSHASSFF
jgi:hypothetical protein